MARFACAAIITGALISGCATPPRSIPEPVPITKECPALADQLDMALFSPVRVLGREEVFRRGGLNRHLWLVMLEQEKELEYCNQRFKLIEQEVERARDTDRQPPQR